MSYSIICLMGEACIYIKNCVNKSKFFQCEKFLQETEIALILINTQVNYNFCSRSTSIQLYFISSLISKQKPIIFREDTSFNKCYNSINCVIMHFYFKRKYLHATRYFNTTSMAHSCGNKITDQIILIKTFPYSLFEVYLNIFIAFDQQLTIYSIITIKN